MKRRQGFTLVELLVVIGIIALLISILLPSLSKARQTANKAKCLSNLHNLGLAIMMYTNNNRGVLPYGTDGVYDSTTSPGNPLVQTWGGLLSVQMGMSKEATAAGAGDATTNRGRAIFICPDAFIPQSTATMNYVKNTYSVHPNLMPEMVSSTSPATALLWPNYRAFGSRANTQRMPYHIAHIPTPADIALMWDGTQEQGDGNACAVSFALDHQQLGGNGNPQEYNNLAWVANNGVNIGTSIDGGVNQDSLDGNHTDLKWGNIRWRHSNNTIANFLFVDGHCDSKSYKTTAAAPGNLTGLMRKNVCVPPPG